MFRLQLVQKQKRENYKFFVKKYLKQHEITACLDITTHVGDAPKRAIALSEEIKRYIKQR